MSAVTKSEQSARPRPKIRKSCEKLCQILVVEGVHEAHPFDEAKILEVFGEQDAHAGVLRSGSQHRIPEWHLKPATGVDGMEQRVNRLVLVLVGSVDRIHQQVGVDRDLCHASALTGRTSPPGARDRC